MSLADFLAKEKMGETHSLKTYNFNTNSVVAMSQVSVDKNLHFF